MVTNAIVSSDGTVLWMYPALIKTYCTLNVKYFPFDSQHCKIEFISWTHHVQQLDIFYSETNAMKTAVYYASANQVRLATSFTHAPLSTGRTIEYLTSLGRTECPQYSIRLEARML